MRLFYEDQINNNLKKIGIIGAGQMGNALGRAAALNGYNTIFFDIDTKKAQEAALNSKADFTIDINEIFNSNIIFLALHKDAVLNFFTNYYKSVSLKSVCVNISTFVTMNDIRNITKDISRIISCKIIGHFLKVASVKSVFVLDTNSEKNKDVEEILGSIGEVIYGSENDYVQLNYLAAEAAMRSTLTLVKQLKEMGYKESVIYAAVKSVFIGTAEQFPFLKPDYFHNMVYKNNPDIINK